MGQLTNQVTVTSRVTATFLENPDRIALLDDRLARRTAQVTDLPAWRTLKILLEAKSRGFLTKLKRM
jgi:predicted nucleic acid-binding protein